MTTDHVSMERLRWRCRRGLLELDIVLGRFIEHYAGLDARQQAAFDSMLDMPDTQLWDMLSGKLVTEDDNCNKLIKLINLA